MSAESEVYIATATVAIAEAKALVVKASKLALKAGLDPDLLGRLAALTIDLDCCRGILDPEWATEGPKCRTCGGECRGWWVNGTKLDEVDYWSRKKAPPKTTCPVCRGTGVEPAASTAGGTTQDLQPGVERRESVVRRELPGPGATPAAGAPRESAVPSTDDETDALLDWGADVGRQRGARRARAASFDASGEHQEDGVQSANPEFPE